MADRGDTHYYVPRLNVWFAVASLLLLISAFWMVIDDWSRGWKDYQREFQKIEVARAREHLRSAEAQRALEEEARLQAALAEVEGRLRERRDDIAEKSSELKELRGLLFKVTEEEKKAKQEYNYSRFLVEERRLHGGNPTYGQELLDEHMARLNAAEAEKEELEVAVAEAQAALSELRADSIEVEKELKATTKGVDLVRNRLARLDPDEVPAKLANVIRDFPGLDFIGPSLQVRKVVLDDLTFELNFTKKPRIDMCMTCHMSIDLPGYDGEDLDQPFRSHPRPDLYLTARSPHPMSQVGCTICHRGSGESLDFVRADHRPSDQEEAEEWYEKYHWHKQHHWDYPMLSSKYVEASCVQCHKTSMELIAPEAPKLAEGYELFERYGCYSCHKVDWFPTKRKPGPSLRKLAQKTGPEFVASWVADPKAFRPTTWMPQVFHLENYPPEGVVAVSEWGKGREILGQEWNETAVAAVTAFVMDRAEDEQLPPVPVEGDAARGREVFRLSGCLACHNMAGFSEEERADARDLALKERGTNEHGPNLRGIATKVTPEWLYRWISDPKSYWPEARMPDLRLSDQEAADVVAYVFEDPEGIFHDTPEGWEGSGSTYDREALEEHARWSFSRLTRRQLQERFEEGEWKDDHALLVAVGEKLVSNHGCHSCHEIPGFEDAMPIGTELTNWGSKVVEKLDWGFVPEILAEEHGWDHHRTEQFKKYREDWLVQKLHEPRSYDRRKEKNPNEKLRMPWFDFTEDEVESIATFVLGLVDDEVQRARMVPTPGELAMDTGLRVMRQKNCAACHVVEPGTITYHDEDGVERTVAGQVLPLDDMEFVPPPLGPGFHPFVADYEDFVEEELEEVIVQLLRDEPGVGRSGDTVVIEGADVVDAIRTTPSWGGDFVPLVVSYYRDVWGWDENDEEYSKTADPEGEGRVQDVDGEWRAYFDEPYDKVRWTFAPPLLVDEGSKLQRDWFYRFLLDPVPLREQMRSRMPTFHWDEGEAGSVADYFAHAAARSWPERYTRRVLVELDLSPEELAAALRERGAFGVSAEEIRSIAAGESRDPVGAMPALVAFGADRGVTSPGPVNPTYEPIPQRAPSAVEPLLAGDPDFFDRVHRLVGPEGPNCFQCHFLGGEEPNAEGPVAWAPDLFRVRERLRPDWTREWMTDPAKIYPGTAMPANFPPGQSQYQELFPGSSEEQVEAVLMWIFNLDRASVRN